MDCKLDKNVEIQKSIYITYRYRSNIENIETYFGDNPNCLSLIILIARTPTFGLFLTSNK